MRGTGRAAVGRTWPRRVAAGLALAVLVVADLPEGIALWQPWASLAALVAVVALGWRRHAPGAAVAVAFGAQLAVEVAARVAGSPTQPTLGHVVVLGALVYSLARWGRQPDLVAGTVVVVAAAIVGALVSGDADVDHRISSALVWALFAASGAASRFRAASTASTAARIRAEERERIARDLHDVVAHHVSAIAIQAEGARAVAPADPEAALATLDHIQRTAAGALTEMRQMVAALRDPDEEAPLAPDTGLTALDAVLDVDATVPVVVERCGDVDGLSRTIQGALARVALEAVTNARRHGRAVERIDVRIERRPDRVVLTVVDDGAAPGPRRHDGFGLVGMTERCVALGGSLHAGPGVDGGWQVRAELPIDPTP